MRVLVTGGRDYADREKVYATLDALEIEEIGHGAARGADSLAGDWAQDRRVSVIAYPANWDRDGKAAGPIRNKRMLDEFQPDMVVAFPGGRGTEHMTSIAIKAGVPVVWIPA